MVTTEINIKNTTSSEIFINDLGLPILPGETLSLPITEAHKSNDLRTYIQSGDILVNDGQNDITDVNEAIALTYLQTKESDTRNDFPKYQLQDNERIVVDDYGQYALFDQTLTLASGAILELRQGAQLLLFTARELDVVTDVFGLAIGVKTRLNYYGP